MHKIIEQYGKEIIETFIDASIISKKWSITEQKTREMLVKQGLITRRVKRVDVFCRFEVKGYYENSITEKEIGYKNDWNTILIVTASGKEIVRMNISTEDIETITEELQGGQ